MAKLSKKDHIALADEIKHHNAIYKEKAHFKYEHLYSLSWFLKQNNPKFDMIKWIDYITVRVVLPKKD